MEAVLREYAGERCDDDGGGGGGEVVLVQLIVVMMMVVLVIVHPVLFLHSSQQYVVSVSAMEHFLHVEQLTVTPVHPLSSSL